ncbi:MAG: Flp family type IVb pilin [Rhodospirillales bacterium]
MRSTFSRLMNDESGATMIEYGLIAALVSVAAIVALTSMGTSIQGIFNVVSGKLSGAAVTAGATPAPAP